jgi:hypothetical protein
MGESHRRRGEQLHLPDDFNNNQHFILSRIPYPYLMADMEYATIVMPLLTPQQFDQPYQTLLKLVRSHFNKYHSPMLEHQLRIELDGCTNIIEDHYKEAKRVISILREPSETDNRAWLLDKTQDLLKHKESYDAIRSAIGSLDTNDGAKINEHLQRAMDSQHFSLKKESLDMTIDDIYDTFLPPQYLIQNLFKRGYLYGMTGSTGSGKTAVALTVAKVVARGEMLGTRLVNQGRVIYLAGENPDDVKGRCIGLFERGTDVRIFSERSREKVEQYIASLIRLDVPIALLVVDTSTAYFIGDNENDNKEALEHAKWLRSLSTRLPGNPTILVCCHPIKYAKEGEEMIPRGGSAFLNEIDGNLGCSKLGDMTILKQVGKYRDVYFPGLSFKREVVYPKRLNGISTIREPRRIG